MTDTFGDLLANAAHWEFEIFLMLLFDGLIAGLLYPFVRKHWAHHIARDLQDVGKALVKEWALNPIAKSAGYIYADTFGTPFVTPDPYAGLAEHIKGDKRCHCAVCVDYPWDDVVTTPAPPLNGRPYYRYVDLKPASWYQHGMATEAIKQKAAQAEVNQKLDKIAAECNCETPLQAVLCNHRVNGRNQLLEIGQCFKCHMSLDEKPRKKIVKDPVTWD